MFDGDVEVSLEILCDEQPEDVAHSDVSSDGDDGPVYYDESKISHKMMFSSAISNSCTQLCIVWYILRMSMVVTGLYTGCN